MKYSKYNVFSAGKMLMFNTLSLSMAQLNEAQMNAFLEQDETFLSSMDMSVLEEFKENGFVIFDNTSEIIFLKDKYWRSRYDKSVLNLSILTTKDCNFCCSYCFEVRDSHSTMMLGDQQRIIKFIAKAVEQYSSININWYGGEPLLNIEAIRNISKATMQLCVETGKSYSSSITTNGYLFDEYVQKELKDLNIRSAQITIDGDRNVHNQRRVLMSGDGTYDIIMKHIEIAAEQFYLDIRVNVDDENIDCLTELIDHISNFNIENIGLHICMVTPVENGIADVQWEKVMTDKIMKTYKYAASKGIRVSKINELLKESSRFCVIDSDSQFTITPKGSLYKCGESFVDDMDPGCIGHINDDGTYDIYKDCNDFWIKDPFAISECAECKILPICMGGCTLKRKVKKMPECIHELKYRMPEMIDMLYCLALGDLNE